MPLLAQRTEADGDPYEILERQGLKKRADEIDQRASKLDNLGPGESVIYHASVRYARQYPERFLASWHPARDSRQLDAEPSRFRGARSALDWELSGDAL